MTISLSLSLSVSFCLFLSRYKYTNRIDTRQAFFKQYLESRRNSSIDPFDGKASTNRSSTGTIEGSNWLWSVFALMAFSSIVVALLSRQLEPKERTFHLFNIAILSTASIASFYMACDLGTAQVEVSQRGPGARQFWYVWYIEWVVTTSP
jgi:bacteriorhodopsin